MNQTYSAIYADRHGREQAEIQNDGQQLQLTVRGVTFSGSDFDSLSARADTEPLLLASFVLHGGDLCACTLHWTMPLPLVSAGVETLAWLDASLVLGEPAPPRGLSQERLGLDLRCSLGNFRSRGTSGWFEDELLELQAQLPPGCYLKACITCAWSDYSPGGHGLFGGLACFRDNKQAYGQVASKSDLFNLWDRRTEFVQETYLCPQFSRRAPGAGYRG